MNIDLKKERFAILDPLRFVAALAVLFYHYSIFYELGSNTKYFLAAAKYGYLGVPFFFMLSGFVISSSAANATPFKFVVARARRLYPAFVACLAITLGIVYFCSGQVFPMKSVILNALILNDYFHVPNIDGVYWTLQAELKFYGCIFILISLRQFHSHMYWLPAWLAASCLHFFTAQPFFMGWFINPGYSFYFIGGVAALLIHKNKFSIMLHIYFFISLLFGVATAGLQTDQFINQAVSFDVLVARFVVFVFYLFFYALALGKLRLNKSPWWFAYLGSISYPLYLLHNRGGKALIDHYQSEISISLLVPLVAFGIVSLALAVHLLVEKPIALIGRRS